MASLQQPTTPIGFGITLQVGRERIGFGKRFRQAASLAHDRHDQPLVKASVECHGFLIIGQPD